MTSCSAAGIGAGFQSQIADLQSQVMGNRTEARRGIAAAAAITPVAVALQPGQSSVSIGGAGYRGEGAISFNFAHRLQTVPLYLSVGYANGGGSEHIGKGAVTYVW